jgi:hypothetical protein
VEKLHTFQEAEEQGYGSRYSLRRWARIGKLSVVRLGARTLRLRQSDLDDFVRRNLRPARESDR